MNDDLKLNDLMIKEMWNFYCLIRRNMDMRVKEYTPYMHEKSLKDWEFEIKDRLKFAEECEEFKNNSLMEHINKVIEL